MRIRPFLLAILLAASLPAAATGPRNFYEASVPVTDQGPDSRGPALRRALEIVLVRVTGQSSLPVETASLLQRATDLVQGYGYEAAPSGGGLRLHAQFDPRAVDAALRSQGLPVWGVNRPTHVAWIAVRDDSPPRNVLDAGNPHAAVVAAAADARGLPLSFPALDSGERQNVGFNPVWGGDWPTLRQASARYRSDAVVVGRMSREGGRWAGRWALLERSEQVEEWSVTRDTLDEALAAGIDELADREASRYVVQTSRAQELRLSVAGVQSVHDYGRALNYVRSLGAVRAVQVEKAQQDSLILRLQIEGDPASMARVIGSGNVLRAEVTMPAGVDQGYVLVAP